MKTVRLLPALLVLFILLLAAGAAEQAGAQTFITMGRLFTTPGERAQLDQLRNSGAAIQAGPAAGPGAPGALGATAPMNGTPGAMPGAASSGADAAPAPPPEPVQLTGMIRRSNGRTTVFVNDEAREAHSANNGKAARVSVDGKTIVLKPGQSYDPDTGAIREIGQ
ncbi:hypothetical protein AB4Z19_05430 [Pseudoduganella sp. RAF19]|uniref:hypothetical protein n=1 Tax=Pseudoduganella sp. RAF19 TaxID=3233052 RepID=UPI003F97590B